MLLKIILPHHVIIAHALNSSIATVAIDFIVPRPSWISSIQYIAISKVDAEIMRQSQTTISCLLVLDRKQVALPAGILNSSIVSFYQEKVILIIKFN